MSSRKKPLVEWQKVKEISSGSQNYADWKVGQHFAEGKEEAERKVCGRAEPDLYENNKDNPEVMHEENRLKERVQKLYKVAQQILTERQWQIFELVGIRAMSYTKAAKFLSKDKPMSAQAVAQTWERVREKLSKVVV